MIISVLLKLLIDVLLPTIIACMVAIGFYVSLQKKEKETKEVKSKKTRDGTIDLNVFREILDYRRSKETKNNRLILYSIDISEIQIADRYISTDEGHIIEEMILRLNKVLKDGVFITRKGTQIYIQDVLGHTTFAIHEQLEKITKVLSRPYLIEGKEFNIKTYIGCLPLDGNTEKLDSIIKKLNGVTKKCKEEGERYTIYEEITESIPITYLEIEKGLERNEFRLVYQPQKDIVTGKVIGVEGLVRWENETRGNIRPDQFIPVAERTGLIQELGYTILNIALKDYKKWARKDIIMSINISLGQFQDKYLAENLKRILEREGVEASHVKLEITETVGIEDINFIKDTLIELKKIGFKIALDDFGKGYSSLNYLKELPFDTIKIDKVFVDNVVENPQDQNFLKELVTFLHGIKMDIIVEGIETKKQLELVQAMGCQKIQGYYISRPIESEDIEQVISVIEEAR